MNLEKISNLEKQLKNIETQMDTLEDSLDTAPEKNQDWMALHRKSVEISAEKYKEIWPDVEIEFNQSRTQFRSKTDDNDSWKVT